MGQMFIDRATYVISTKLSRNGSEDLIGVCTFWFGLVARAVEVSKKGSSNVFSVLLGDGLLTPLYMSVYDSRPFLYLGATLTKCPLDLR